MTTKLPAGNYYVGDLCYVIPNNLWDEFLGNWDFDYSGVYGDFLSSLYWVAETEYGDGIYDDQFGNTYAVDAGIIGCINLDQGLEIKNKNAWGQFIKFDSEFTCLLDGGVIKIANLIIDTN
jgi:hypothetical protein